MKPPQWLNGGRGWLTVAWRIAFIISIVVIVANALAIPVRNFFWVSENRDLIEVNMRRDSLIMARIEITENRVEILERLELKRSVRDSVIQEDLGLLKTHFGIPLRKRGL